MREIKPISKCDICGEEISAGIMNMVRHHNTEHLEKITLKPITEKEFNKEFKKIAESDPSMKKGVDFIRSILFEKE